jgi:hypothetical protein
MTVKNHKNINIRALWCSWMYVGDPPTTPTVMTAWLLAGLLTAVVDDCCSILLLPLHADAEMVCYRPWPLCAVCVCSLLVIVTQHYTNWRQILFAESRIYINSLYYTGHFIMFCMITNIYNKKTKRPTLMELFAATGKLKKFFLTTRDVRCVRHGW